MMFCQSLDSHRISKRLAKALTRLRVCAGWCEPLLVTALIFSYLFSYLFSQVRAKPTLSTVWCIWSMNKRAHGPWITHPSPCHEKRMFTKKYKSHFCITLVQIGNHSDQNHILSSHWVQSKYINLHNFSCLAFIASPKGHGRASGQTFACIMF